MIDLTELPDDYAAISSFGRSPRASALALMLRRAQCAELSLAPEWRAPNHAALELRILSCDGSLVCYRHSGSLEGIERIPIHDAASIEAVVPPAAARLFASALEDEQLRSTVAAQLSPIA
jgi:hypothetical protein